MLAFAYSLIKSSFDPHLTLIYSDLSLTGAPSQGTASAHDLLTLSFVADYGRELDRVKSFILDSIHVDLDKNADDKLTRLPAGQKQPCFAMSAGFQDPVKTKLSKIGKKVSTADIQISLENTTHVEHYPAPIALSAFSTLSFTLRLVGNVWTSTVFATSTHVHRHAKNGDQDWDPQLCEKDPCLFHQVAQQLVYAFEEEGISVKLSDFRYLNSWSGSLIIQFCVVGLPLQTLHAMAQAIAKLVRERALHRVLPLAHDRLDDPDPLLFACNSCAQLPDELQRCVQLLRPSPTPRDVLKKLQHVDLQDAIFQGGDQVFQTPISLHITGKSGQDLEWWSAVAATNDWLQDLDRR